MYDVHANQITQWKAKFQNLAAMACGDESDDVAPPVDLKLLHAKRGELTLENDFLESALTKAGFLNAMK